MADQIIIHVNGTIQAAVLSEGDNVFVRAHFVYGSDWTLISGAEQVVSQVAKHASPGGVFFKKYIKKINYK